MVAQNERRSSAESATVHERAKALPAQMPRTQRTFATESVAALVRDALATASTARVSVACVAQRLGLSQSRINAKIDPANEDANWSLRDNLLLALTGMTSVPLAIARAHLANLERIAADKGSAAPRAPEDHALNIHVQAADADAALLRSRMATSQAGSVRTVEERLERLRELDELRAAADLAYRDELEELAQMRVGR